MPSRRTARKPKQLRYEGLRAARREHAPDAAPSPTQIRQKDPGPEPQRAPAHRARGDRRDHQRPAHEQQRDAERLGDRGGHGRPRDPGPARVAVRQSGEPPAEQLQRTGVEAELGAQGLQELGAGLAVGLARLEDGAGGVGAGQPGQQPDAAQQRPREREAPQRAQAGGPPGAQAGEPRRARPGEPPGAQPGGPPARARPDRPPRARPDRPPRARPGGPRPGPRAAQRRVPVPTSVRSYGSRITPRTEAPMPWMIR